MTVATFGAGCFWGVELTFQKTAGVTSTSVGYTGGTSKNPTYEQVCTGSSGHAEVVRVEFDPAIVSYEQLLDVLWGCHDPTTLNRQGPDIGTQYRSAIYFHSPEQKTFAQASIDNLDKSGRFSSAVVTEITPAPEYYLAEDYHQQYLEKRGMGSCH
ncbi:MAG: peptide-methionine (S)-S-oxide reductase MsrA [Nitrospinaceae bacterium]|nr:peptide-methionine (S)-S-oxide reductase MsrA [Nitrospinaceae bacterium]